MFRKLVEGDNKFVKGFVKFVYNEEKDINGEYAVCRDSGLQYLGEFFERYERESLNPINIMKGIACGNVDLPEHSIYDGQLEYFMDKVDYLMKHNDVFLDKLCYVIFLQKVGYKDKSKENLEKILDSLKLDLDFLTLTMALGYGSLKIEEETKNKLIELLDYDNLDLDVLSFIKGCALRELRLDTITPLVALKDIEKIYKLKAKNIHDSKKLKFYKSLKKIGTRKLSFEDVEEFIGLNEHDFYFVSLKISNEINEGLVLYRTNEFLADLIQQNINVNSKTYPYLCKIEISTDKSNYWKKKIALNNIDFNFVTSDYYYEFMEACLLMQTPLKYESYKDLVLRSSFLEYFKNLNYTDYRAIKNNIIMNVIANCSDKNINDFYFSCIVSLKDISLFDKFILVEKGYLDFVDFVERDLVSVSDMGVREISLIKKDVYGMNCGYKAIYKEEMSKFNLKYVAFELLKYIVQNDIKIQTHGNTTWMVDFVKDIYEVSLYNLLELDECKDSLSDYLSIILDYILMYDSGSYLRTLISLYKDEKLSKYLDISDEEIKMLCKESLNFTINDANLLNKIKSIVFDEKEVCLYECKSNFDSFLASDWYHCYSSNNHWLDALSRSFNKGNDDCKAKVREYIKEKMIENEKPNIKYLSFRILSDLTSKNIIEKEDALYILSYYLDEII